MVYRSAPHASPNAGTAVPWAGSVVPAVMLGRARMADVVPYSTADWFILDLLLIRPKDAALPLILSISQYFSVFSSQAAPERHLQGPSCRINEESVTISSLLRDTRGY